MSTLKKSSRIAIDEIENELRQIDTIVNSWSSGRSLRFDPAHVRPRPEIQTSQEKERTFNPQKCLKVTFVLNLIAFCFAVGYTASQAITGFAPAAISISILTGGMIMMFSLNLVLVIWGNAVSQKLIRKNQHLTRVTSRKTERSTSL